MSFRNTRSVMYTLGAFLAMGVYLIPVFWMYVSGLKTEQAVYTIPPTVIPDPITFEPMLQTIASGGGRYFANSLLIAASATALTLLLAGFTGFALARMKSRIVAPAVLAVLSAQMLPTVLRVTPLFVLFNRLGLINSYAAVILANASVTVPFAVIMLRTAFLAAPTEIEEASLIDGCTLLQSFFRISIPMSQAGFIVVGALSFVWSFGDFVFALSFLSRQSMHPAALGLYNFVGAEATSWNNVMAFAGLTALPLIVLFLVLQKHIVTGLSTGSFR